MLSAASFLLLAAASLTAAVPCGGGGGKTPQLPKTGHGKDLPPPPPDATLKYIALGFGIQNYTCAEVGGKEASTGALAMLYDVTPLYPGQSSESLSKQEFKNLTAQVLFSHDVPLNFNQSTDGRVDPNHPGASLTEPFTPDAPLEVCDLPPMRFLGHHFFDAQGVPLFVLDNGAIKLPVKKVDAVDAPRDASPGPDGTGAVDWLFLGPKEGNVGARFVYRVLTAGGNSHGCSKAAGEDSTSYTATYWIYS